MTKSQLACNVFDNTQWASLIHPDTGIETELHKQQDGMFRYKVGVAYFYQGIWAMDK